MIAEGDFHVTKMDGPKISMKENEQKEKRIVMDALSQNASSTKHRTFESALPNVSTSLVVTDLHRAISLQPPNPKLLSHSLPNSANSSPMFTSNLMKKKSNGGRSVESPCQASSILKHKCLVQEMHLRRSKSYGEGRAYASLDEFDLWLVKPSTAEQHDNIHHGSFSITEAIKEGPVNGKDMESCEEEGFKCSALCLYLPGFGKAKAVKARKEGSEMGGAISRTVSLEKFECGSWASSALCHEIEGDPMNSYFDLPMELIKCSANDVHAPVTSAFVFEKGLKGVLKTGSSRTSGRKSDTSPLHVGFSTSHTASAASCISPRLRKVKEDFNAFLEAQSA
ncbi:uncharacterized protein LOC113859443 [Abrus precatorius]|uniref:Uncharacterized protein LOC113859443 n=1 Tax=Abrus precatorius TaxID=3816 RepID=A0A8B8KXE3_ABRPR|nr:uncharacterized protein LOC113859443 [Abrus precatorius]